MAVPALNLAQSHLITSKVLKHSSQCIMQRYLWAVIKAQAFRGRRKKVTRTSLLYKLYLFAVQTNGRKTRFVRVQRNFWDFKKIEKVVRGTKSKAAGIRDVVGDKKAGVSCKVLFDTIIQVWCRQCEWLVYSEEMLLHLRHFYKLLMNSDLEFHCTFIIFWLLYWSLEFHGSKIWIPYQSSLEAHRYFLKM